MAIQATIVPGTTDIYIRERQILVVGGYVSTRPAVITLTYAALPYSAKYYAVSNYLYIDITDLCRQQSTGTITVTDGSTTATVSFSYAGLINPKEVLAPPIDYTLSSLYTNIYDRVFPLPRMYQSANDIYAPLGYILHPSIVQPRSLNISSPFSISQPEKTGATAFAQANASLPPVVDVVASGGIGLISRSRILTRDCRRQYVSIKWSDRFIGAQKQHAWEVVKWTSKTGEEYQLESLYVSSMWGLRLRTEVVGLTVRISELTPYDVWYYSDILQPSRKGVYIDFDKELGRSENFLPCIVKTKDIEITHQSDRIEIEIELKNYGTDTD